MTNDELQRLVMQISTREFGKPFKHQAVFNSRLQTTGGRYHLRDHHIDINPKMLTDFGEETLEGVIKHELVHYHLSMAGLPFNHRSREFRTLLAQVGGSRFAPAPKHRQGQAVHSRSRHIYIYECEKCGQRYTRRRRINTRRFACGICGGRLNLAEAYTQES
ncbi:Metallopeptidase Zinc SprT [Furfurilactobacillus rossiae]|uniref:SprT family protein n=1 Tax=Furfurilactobacillus rossiae TaxID=231049 RepID=UPI0015BADBC3|nr:SprT family protein [Furfurilactobacillus rossiae]MCF6166827.1 SprT family protein [Furfurilactobacillus rossiae]QLE63563.1 Metallopeptidase Zinc SprT [Furfurilactobacillus rossiae]